ncbi:hypothetical protein [Devosia sp.]|uniref:hypothetical protein n=1 Tax=Devosia sp. TaxID=1871048 RepID=UPI001A07CCD7|nr:hypothetical protein [Devosia sp.]MBE0580095.1 hypothetical protein [Devosia sp.]
MLDALAPAVQDASLLDAYSVTVSAVAEAVGPSKGRFTHHIELWSEKDVDEFVRSKLQEAWQHAA